MNESAIDRPVALVIEDDAQTTHLLRYILQKEGFSVKTVNDGRDAEWLIEKAPPPALVTLDCLLPYVDGIELLEMMQHRRAWKDVPVLMLSTNSHKRDVARALEAGAAAYIVKPFRLADLRATVQRLIGSSNVMMSAGEQFHLPFTPASRHRPAAAMMLLAA